MSYLLAIDTCTRHTSIALRDATSLRAELSWECERHHTAAVTARIKQVLDECGLKAAQLGAVAVALGPGSFTGVRCGLSIANGMAVAAELGAAGAPTFAMIGVNAFDIIIAAQPTPIETSVIYALIEAGRNRVAVQAFDPKNQQAIGAFVLKSHTEFIASIEQPAYICGYIPPQLSSLLHVKVAPAPLNLRRAGYLAELGYARWQRGAIDNAMTLAPIYPPESNIK